MTIEEFLLGFIEAPFPHPVLGTKGLLWRKSKTPDDYGSCNVNGRYESPNRVAWKLQRGEIPKGLFLCHKCDVPACGNMEHQFLGTAKQNCADMIAKGRNRYPLRKSTKILSPQEIADWSTLPELLRPSDVEGLLAVSRSTLDKMFKTGLLPIICLTSRSRRVRKSDLIKYCELLRLHPQTISDQLRDGRWPGAKPDEAVVIGKDNEINPHVVVKKKGART